MVELDNKSFLIIVLGICLLFTVCICVIVVNQPPEGLTNIYNPSQQTPNSIPSCGEIANYGVIRIETGYYGKEYEVYGWICERCGPHEYYSLPSGHKIGELDYSRNVK